MMAETKQITATIPITLAEWIEGQPERGMISFSKMVEILLQEAKENRGKRIKSNRNRMTKYIK